MNSAKTPRFVQALDGLWHACSAPQALAALGALLAGTLAFAAIFAQLPAALDTLAAERWLTTTAASYGDAGPFLRAVDAFRVLGSPWMRALLAALAFNLALRTVAQGCVVRRLWRPTEVLPAPPGLPAQYDSFPGALDVSVTRAENLLRLRSPGVAVEVDGARAQLYAGGHRAGLCGPLLVYAGGLLILVGLLANDTMGWRMPDIALAVGRTAPLIPGGDSRATLNAAAGEERDMSANVTLARATAGKTVSLGFARPARWGNVWVAQQATGPALAVTARDSSSRPILLQSLEPGGAVDQTLHVLFQQTQGEQAFAIPTRNLTFRAVSYPALPERGILRPVFLVEGYRGTEPSPAFSELVESELSFTLDGVALTVQRDHFVALEVAYLPGLIPLLLGCLLLLLGVMLSAFLGPVRAWVGMAANHDNVAVAVRVAAAARARTGSEALASGTQVRAGRGGARS